jgi:hypothetical protein
VLSGRASWEDAGAALVEHAAFLARYAAEQEVQTNEVQRSWALLPALLAASDGRPLELLELGSSAGLNLVWDSYHYRYATGDWGSGPFELSGEDRAPPPADLLRRSVEVVRRRGIDRSPIDVTTAEGALLLESFVWADQTERLARLRAAIDIVRGDPPELIRGDYVEELPQLLADRVPGAQLVVYETATSMYLARDAHERVRNAMHAAGLVEPFVFLTTRSSAGDDFYTLEAVRWPEGERSPVEHFDFHGAWLEWL